MTEKIQASGFSIEGQKRSVNGDSWFADAELGLFIVCDGVSGHTDPSKASLMCIEFVSDYVRTLKSTVEKVLSGDALRQRLVEGLREAISLANSKVFKASGEKLNEHATRMACTLTAVLVSNRWAIVAQVGDSRAYLYRAGDLRQLTEDHTVSNEMLKSKQWNEDQASLSPYAHVLSRAIGMSEVVTVDTLELQLTDTDMILLCSDGVHDSMSDREIVALLSPTDEVASMSKKIAEKAVKNKGNDDTTLVLIRYSRPSDAAELTSKHKMEAMMRIPLFSNLSFRELAHVLSLAQEVRIPAGTIILKEGVPGTELFVVMSGDIEITKGGQVITRRFANKTLGEIAIVDGGARSASAVASTDCVLVKIPREPLFELMRNESKLAVKLLWQIGRQMSHRLREVTEELVVERSRGSAQAPESTVEMQRPF